ncbi:DNA polymerase III subunit delta' [Hoyosella rhizosphaerae]|uniref:DNA polymerase III subunit delta n=1 Tax=Hoyosella rhizosphaerae TaxID=1755582 RepID=A0A916XJ79_9ACTN|nr:DNA polymerase III subunit delta' [Hoyosella rhizosphaerae]MBN4925341.1 DNA polymerase III subunit delta' [Hoyosella rhizosphaerae]GGC76059.1 DNA polymerase III subunit delta' [Hoyosella rhizosphaerae]
MAPVFERLIGQDKAVRALSNAAVAARHINAGTHTVSDSSAMTHAWLFTGPPGSGRSVAALSLAAALQCTNPDRPGCGHCAGCTAVMDGNHPDVRRIIPTGISIAVAEMRAIVQTASRRPSVGAWHVVIIEDADRLTEGAANALLKVVEEPPAHTVFMLCAPSPDPHDIAVTLRSRCRHIVLATPSAQAIADVLHQQDGLDVDTARWAAAISAGHMGRARRLSHDSEARQRREAVLSIPSTIARPAAAIQAADTLVKTAFDDAKTLGAELDEKETDELKTALGAGGTGKGAMGAMRGSAGALKELERKQKSRATRTVRDALDRALIDLLGFYRDALLVSLGADLPPIHPDKIEHATTVARTTTPEALLRSIDSILECRAAIEFNIKPELAVTAMCASVSEHLRA